METSANSETVEDTQQTDATGVGFWHFKVCKYIRN